VYYDKGVRSTLTCFVVGAGLAKLGRIIITARSCLLAHPAPVPFLLNFNPRRTLRFPPPSTRQQRPSKQRQRRRPSRTSSAARMRRWPSWCRPRWVALGGWLGGHLVAIQLFIEQLENPRKMVRSLTPRFRFPSLRDAGRHLPPGHPAGDSDGGGAAAGLQPGGGGGRRGGGCRVVWVWTAVVSTWAACCSE
jgi:hypothetical protein